MNKMCTACKQNRFNVSSYKTPTETQYLFFDNVHIIGDLIGNQYMSRNEYEQNSLLETLQTLYSDVLRHYYNDHYYSSVLTFIHILFQKRNSESTANIFSILTLQNLLLLRRAVADTLMAPLRMLRYSQAVICYVSQQITE